MDTERRSVLVYCFIGFQVILLSGFLLSYSFWSFRNPVVSCLQGFAGPGEAVSLMRHTWRASRPRGLQTVLLCQRGVAPVHNIMAAAMKAKDQVWPSVPSLQWTFCISACLLKYNVFWKHMDLCIQIFHSYAFM